MDYKNYNDYELIYMVRENDSDCATIMYNKYLPIIKNISYEYYLKFKNCGYDYDDFFQETSIAFSNAIDSYNDSKNSLFYSYCTLCMRRALISFCRNITSSKRYLSNSNLVDIDEYPICDLKSNVERIINYEELYDSIRKVILDLPLKSSSVLELWLNGFSYGEIAILLDVSTTTVEYRNRSARKILQGKMKSKYFDCY